MGGVATTTGQVLGSAVCALEQASPLGPVSAESLHFGSGMPLQSRGPGPPCAVSAPLPRAPAHPPGLPRCVPHGELGTGPFKLRQVWRASATQPADFSGRPGALGFHDSTRACPGRLRQPPRTRNAPGGSALAGQVRGRPHGSPAPAGAASEQLLLDERTPIVMRRKRNLNALASTTPASANCNAQVQVETATQAPVQHMAYARPHARSCARSTCTQFVCAE